MRTILCIVLIFSVSITAQDTTSSQAFKPKAFQPKKPLIKPKYPSYPLIAGYLLIKDANEGDPFAQHELGLRYLLGRGFPPDTVAAVKWIRKAVEKNLTIARFNYGIIQNNGIGVEWNPFEAYRNFKYAAEMGMQEGELVYGLFLTDNLVVNRNLIEAYIWVKRAAENDYEPAKEILKEFEKSGVAVSVDTSKDMVNPPVNYLPEFNTETTPLMEQNWELDFYDFGEDTTETDSGKSIIEKVLNENSKELKKILGIKSIKNAGNLNDTTGISLVKFAAEAGSPEALLLLGRGYEKGIGVNKDFILAAVNYLRAYRLGSSKAAEYLLKMIQSQEFFQILKAEIDSNNPDAMYTWAGLIALGFDFHLTDEQAFELLLKAVKQNHIFSIIEAGLSYFSGTLVETNKEKAIEYWTRAVELGSREAEVRIAFSKISGNGKTKELSDAIEVLKKASDEGSVLAQTALGYCYEKGIGVKQDKAQASIYYRNAAQRGNETAFISLKNMYDEIRPNEEEFQIYE